jgi:hypothetical protein
MIALLSLAATALSPTEFVVTSREPVLPEYLSSDLAARCGSVALAVRGVGLSAGPDAQAQVSIDGATLTGEQVDRLVSDLGNARAAYRITVRCSANGFELRIYTGEADARGEVRFLSGTANLRKGAIQRYSGLEPSDAETFWFR